MNKNELEKERSLNTARGANRFERVSPKDNSNLTKLITPGLRVYAKSEQQVRGQSESGDFVGTVHHLDGTDYIKLDAENSPHMQHYWIPTSWITRIDDQAIHLSKTKAEFHEEVYESRPDELMNKAI